MEGSVIRIARDSCIRAAGANNYYPDKSTYSEDLDAKKLTAHVKAAG
jgi:hypothetical protein